MPEDRNNIRISESLKSHFTLDQSCACVGGDIYVRPARLIYLRSSVPERVDYLINIICFDTFHSVIYFMLILSKSSM